MNEFAVNRELIEVIDQLSVRYDRLIKLGVVPVDISDEEFDRLQITIDTPDLTPEIELYILNRYAASIMQLVLFEEMFDERI